MLLPSSFPTSRIAKAVKRRFKTWSLTVHMLAPVSRTAARLQSGGTHIKEDSFRLRNTYCVQPKKSTSNERFIVCSDIHSIYSGLGCCLLVLAPCWKYALKTGRTLVIDWRGNPYTRDKPELNLFSRLFEPPDTAALGVPSIADDSVNALRLPQPILGQAGPIAHESGVVDTFPGYGVGTPTMRKLLVRCEDVAFPTVIPSLTSTYDVASLLGPRRLPGLCAVSFKEAQHLYKSLKLRPQWADTVSDFQATHMAGQPIIGVHVRHGNGEGRYRKHFLTREIRDFSTFVASLVRRIRRYADKRFNSEYAVFLCTDSDEVVTAMRPYFPSLVSRKIWRPSPGEGVDFDHAYKQSDGGIRAAADALIDMHLLAKCDAVLMTRPTSFAAHVPYIMEKPDAVFLDHKQTARI